MVILLWMLFKGNLKICPWRNNFVGMVMGVVFVRTIMEDYFSMNALGNIFTMDANGVFFLNGTTIEGKFLKNAHRGLFN